MSTAQRELLPEQTRYLGERGFQVVQGEPSTDEAFPYVTLRDPQQFLETSEITYHEMPDYSVGTAEVAHPSTMDGDALVALIESTVAQSMDGEGQLFRTTPGQPIKVFVIDNAWKDVADALAAKYKTS